MSTPPLDTILCGDALDVLRSLPDACVDAIVTDPPYGLGAAPDMLDVLRAWLAGEVYTPRGKGGFMGKAWDAFVPGPEYWRECLRVLKPGGYALVFAGTRTWDVMGLALRLAGFELRDTLQWLYGSGFPKSLDVGKAIDKAAGARRVKVGESVSGKILRANGQNERPYQQGQERITHDITAPATDAARQWDGWGSALKPAWEPVILCRKPLAASTVAANVLAHGVGALNIGQSRVAHDGEKITPNVRDTRQAGEGWTRPWMEDRAKDERRQVAAYERMQSAGRWPANLLLSHSVWCAPDACAEGCPVAELDAQSGVQKSGVAVKRHGVSKSTELFGNIGVHPVGTPDVGYGDTGGASRYFATFRYQSKASRAERNRGCEGLPERVTAAYGVETIEGAASRGRMPRHAEATTRNHHPTVKPLALMSWLITLITPPGGVVLDPFAGSGSTLCAAKAGGWRYIGIEREAEYVAICEARLAATERPGSLGSAVMMEQPKPVKAVATKKRAAKRQPIADLWQESAV